MGATFDMRWIALFAGACLFAGSMALPCAYASDGEASSMEVTVTASEDWGNEVAEVPVIDASDLATGRSVAAGTRVPKAGDGLEIAASAAAVCAAVAGPCLFVSLLRSRSDGDGR